MATCPDRGHEWILVNGFTLCKKCDSKYHVLFPKGTSGMGHAQPVAMELDITPGARYFIGGTLYQINQVDQSMDVSSNMSLSIDLRSLPSSAGTQIVTHVPMPGYDPEHDTYSDRQLTERTE